MVQTLTYQILWSLAVLFLLAGCSKPLQKSDPEVFSQLEADLGRQLFFDPILSKNKTQSCATCHNPGHAFADNRQIAPNGAVSLGDDGQSFGDRNTPTATYAQFSPPFHYDSREQAFVGGQFWDGRAKDLQEQAKGPPLNPAEMNMVSKKAISKRFYQDQNYRRQFAKLYSKTIFENPDKVYEAAASAIAAFEKTKEFAPFDSKYDRFLQGTYELTPLEDLGRSLFFSNNNTNCASCHLLKTEDAAKETFTNYRYHNIGTPRNKSLLSKTIHPQAFKDMGLMNNPAVKNLSNASSYAGKMKVPTLRNVAVTAPYMHNGVFEDLETVILFYDQYVNEETAINPETGQPWAKPEVKVGQEDLKLLQSARPMSERKVQALVAFLKLLTDKRYEHLLEDE